MASYFGPCCDFKLEAGSPPFTVFRNKEGHQVKSNFSAIATKKQYELYAWQNTLYYKQHQQDFPIPSDLLFETTMEDSQLRNNEAHKSCLYSGRNSVLGLQHEDHSLVVHTAGKSFDQLVLRYVDDLQPELVDLPHSLAGQKPPPGISKEFGSTSGFVLPLGGLQIQQVEAWGTTEYNTACNLLARSAHSLYHVRTLNLQDSFPRPPPHCEPPVIPQFWSQRPLVLDPVQKWDLSTGQGGTICSLSGSKSALASSYFLVKDSGGGGGAVTELHSLSPHSGPRRVLPRGCSVFPLSAEERQEEVAVSVESLLHPHLCLLSRGASLFMKDTRMASPSHLLAHTPLPVTSLLALQDTNTANSSSSSSSCSTETTNYLLVGQAEDILLMDLRYSRNSLAQRPAPGGTHFMRKATLPVQSSEGNKERGGLTGEESCDREVVLTAGAKGRQMFTHQLHLSFSPRRRHHQHPSTPPPHPAAAASLSSSFRSESHFLHCGGVFGGRAGGVSWESAGWPLIDRTREDASRLLGMDLLPLSSSRRVSSDRRDTSSNSRNRSDVESENRRGRSQEEDEREREGGGVRGDSLEALHARCQGVLLQQAATGDVFAQLVQCSLRPGAEEEEGGQCNGREGHVARGQYEARRKRRRKRRAPEQKAPIQVNLPVGNRCPPFPVRTTEQAKRNHSDEPNENGREEEEEEKGEKERGAATSTGRGLGAAPILRQQDRGKRSTGLGLRGALLPQDGGGSGGSGESSWSRNTYPLGERNLVPHQEDTETKRMSVVVLDPAEVHLEPDHSMRSDPTIKVVKVPFRLLEKAHVCAMLLEEQVALVRALELHFFTLYELWGWFVDHTGHDCDIELLRQSMLEVMHPSKSRYSNSRDTASSSSSSSVAAAAVRIKNQHQHQGQHQPLCSVELMVLPPPPASLLASADGLQMELLQEGAGAGAAAGGAGGGGGASAGEARARVRQEPCRCHKAIEEYLRREQTQRQRQSRATPVSGSCYSVDELAESNSWGGEEEQEEGGSLPPSVSLSTCAQPTCLALHCLGFKIAGQLCPAPAAPLHIAPSRRNPAFQHSEQAKRARLEAVQEAQSAGGGHVQVSDVTLELMEQLRNDWGEDDEE